MNVNEKTLDDFEAIEYPRNKCVLQLLKIDNELQIVMIGFPSWSKPDEINVCHYFLKDRTKDFCLCEGAERFKKRCWHLKYRAIILKAFLNRKLGDDKSWLENIELYGSHSIEQIKSYIMALLDEQPEVSQADLLDLELLDYDGEPIDRRRIGVAFKLLSDEGYIEPVRQMSAQYSKRKGGKIWVWRKAIQREIAQPATASS